MATKKRKSTKRRTAARRKKAEQRLPAGLGTLFGGLLLMVLAFVRGDSVWRVLHDVLFGLFGCGSFVLGAAVCCLAVLYTRGEELLSRILKLVLGLIFVCGTVIVFSDIQPQGLSALQMLSACYANGVNAWLSGGAMGFVLGGVLLLLCGRPAANLIMVVLLLCGSLYIFDITPAEVWVWLCAVTGGIHARGGERGGGPLPEWVLSQLGQKRGAPALRGTGLRQHGGIPAEARPKAFRVSQRGVRVQCQQNLTQAVDGMLWNHGPPPFWSFPVF